jgi:hypothetical protein
MTEERQCETSSLVRRDKAFVVALILSVPGSVD